MVTAYHVTCHDCPFEGVYEDHERALAEWNDHERATDHETSFLEIERPRPETP